MARSRHDNSNGYYTTIATKISNADKAKLYDIAEGLNMSFYELMKGLLLAIIRYFDTDSMVTDEHNCMINAFANTLFSLEGSFSPMAIKGHEQERVKKAILFVERPKKQPQLLSVYKNELGNLKESYNFDDMLRDFLAAFDPDLLQTLIQTKKQLGYFSIAHTLHVMVMQRKPAPVDMIAEEIAEMFSDTRISTGERINEEIFYKGKNNKWEATTTLTGNKKRVRISS